MLHLLAPQEGEFNTNTVNTQNKKIFFKNSKIFFTKSETSVQVAGLAGGHAAGVEINRGRQWTLRMAS